MDDKRCREFFCEPNGTYQRRYEALRAYFVEGCPIREIADQFGYKASALRVMISRFRARCQRSDISPFFSANPEDDRPVDDAAKTSTAPRPQRKPIAGR